MNLSGKKILITGANGFIGINLINKFKKHRKNIYAVIEPGSETKFIKGVKHKFIDITKAEILKRYVLKIKPDIIIHLAARVNNDLSKSNLIFSTKVNVGGTLNLLECASLLKAKPYFAFISTGEVYGAVKNFKFNENSDANPVSIYAITKFAAEDLCGKYAKAYGLPVLILRPSVIYGPYQKEKMFIPSLITSLLKGRDFDATGGKQVRDFIYVDDFIDALCALIKKHNNANLVPGTKFALFNVSAGVSHSVKKTALKIRGMIGPSAKVNIGALKYRENEIWNYRLSNSKLKKAALWKPKYTLDEGLRKTISWYEKNII